MYINHKSLISKPILFVRSSFSFLHKCTLSVYLFLHINKANKTFAFRYNEKQAHTGTIMLLESIAGKTPKKVLGLKQSMRQDMSITFTQKHKKAPGMYLKNMHGLPTCLLSMGATFTPAKTKNIHNGINLQLWDGLKAMCLILVKQCQMSFKQS